MSLTGWEWRLANAERFAHDYARSHHGFLRRAYAEAIWRAREGVGEPVVCACGACGACLTRKYGYAVVEVARRCRPEWTRPKGEHRGPR